MIRVPIKLTVKSTNKWLSTPQSYVSLVLFSAVFSVTQNVGKAGSSKYNSFLPNEWTEAKGNKASCFKGRMLSQELNSQLYNHEPNTLSSKPRSIIL